ncbi:MAG: rhodanese-like domain-containing protein [Pseudomonadota bacterium]
MNHRNHFLILVFLVLTTALVSGCGSSGGEKHSPLALQVASADYPNADLLITGASLQNSLDASDLIVIDARTAGYNSGHIPGAINLIHGTFWTGGSGLKSLTVLQDLLGAAGLTRDKTYVIYDNTTTSWGAAGRIFWMLEYLGCTKVHILNGGWDKWMADGRPTETTTKTLPARTFTAVVNSSIRSTKESIRSRMADSDFAIVDARTDEEFIGWQLYGEARGGHIPGAVQIPYEWFYNSDKTVLSYKDLKALFESRGITSEKEITSHCTAGIRSGFVYFALRLLGCTRASNYDASIFEWAAADAGTYPMEQMANYQVFVNADWVRALISGGNPQTYPGHGYVIIEASSAKGADDMTSYLTGHIPGAIYFNIYRQESGWNNTPKYPYQIWSDGNLLPDADLLSCYGNLGINSQATVVIYGKGLASLQPFRLAWGLMYAGVQDVRILNGGWEQWIANGGVMETAANTPVPVSFGLTVVAHPEYLATTEQIKAMQLDSSSVLADIRSWSEFIGETNPYTHNGFTAKARIPGAVWVHEPSWYFDKDRTLRSYAEIDSMWQSVGITSGKNIAFYCGTGWRSSLGFIVGYMMGFANVANYDSGFYGWSYNFNNPSNPIDTGIPTNGIPTP